MTELELFQKALSQAKYVPHPSLPIGTQELSATGLAFARVNPQGTLGFTKAGRTCIQRLASGMHAKNERYRRGASLAAFRDRVASAALDYYSKRASLVQADLEDLKGKLERWFRDYTRSEKRFIPCSLLPRDASSFEVGPVRFISAGQLAAEGIDISSFGELLFEFANSRRGRWFARVEVRGEEARRIELANAAVDLALASVHLVFPGERPMYRLSGRAAPDWVVSFTMDDRGGVWPSNSSNLTPGDTLSSEYFDHAIDANRALLESCGKRISGFLSVDQELDGMSHAWCDAAYWYFEGANDELDTAALAKLEACLENLTCSKKRQQSTPRLRGLLQRVLLVPLSQPLSQYAPLTYNDFVEELVEARSRVLHGTASTLAGGSKLTRSDATRITGYLLKATSVLMDMYREQCPDADMSLTAFQDWLEKRRAEMRESSRATEVPSAPGASNASEP